MQGLWHAALGTLFTFGMTAAGAALVFVFGRQMTGALGSVCMGFAGGVMSAAAAFSLLLPAVEQIRAMGGNAAGTSAAGFLLGALLLLAADAQLSRRQADADETGRRQRLMMAAVTLHNIPEGMAVGLAFAAAAQGGRGALAAAWALALGVGLQNVPEGTAIALPLRMRGMSRGCSFFWGAASGVVEPLFGMLAALTAAFCGALLPGLMAFSAGAMMLVVFAEMVPEAAKYRCGIAAAAIGYALMMALDTCMG